MNLRSLRGLLVAHPLVFFTLGVLFAGQMAGEPFHSRLWLALLVGLALVGGVLYESNRKNGTLELLDRLAQIELPVTVALSADVRGFETSVQDVARAAAESRRRSTS